MSKAASGNGNSAGYVFDSDHGGGDADSGPIDEP